MTARKHNQAPVAPGVETFRHQELVQYNDGEMAVGFRTPGDVLNLGEDSFFKYARTVGSDGGDQALVVTRSGNTYGIGSGLVINKGASRAYHLPTEIPQITIGEPWVVPGVGVTTEVQQVLFRHKLAAPGYAGVQIDSPSPFPALGRAIDAASHMLNPQ